MLKENGRALGQVKPPLNFCDFEVGVYLRFDTDEVTVLFEVIDALS